MQSGKTNGMTEANIYLFISLLMTLYGITDFFVYAKNDSMILIFLGFAAILASIKMRSTEYQHIIQFVIGLCFSLFFFLQAILKHNQFSAILGLLILIVYMVQLIRNKNAK